MGFLFCVFILGITIYFYNLHYSEHAIEKEAVKSTVEEFWSYIRDTTEENRDINQVFDLLYYNKHELDEIRKDHFQGIILHDYKIKKIKKLVDGIYKINMYQDQENEDEKNAHYYVVYIDNKWHIVFGKKNIPDEYMKKLTDKNIELPDPIIPEDTIVINT